MEETTRILIVEDKSTDADLAKYIIQRELKDCQFQVVETREDFLKELDLFRPNVVLSDYSLPHFNGMTALQLVLTHAPLTPLIIWTGSISEDVAVECMKAGANNYVLKENLKRLVPAIVHALEERQLLLERKQAEQKYQSIIENSVEGIFQSTPQGRYLNVNPAMARIYGYDSSREMIESVTSIAEQIYVDSSRRMEFLNVLNSQDSVQNFEERNYRKDKSVIWTSTSARAVRDAQGNILYYEGFIQDITQRKQAEEALQSSEKRFRALIENGLDDISLLAADGTLLWESPSTIRNLGYSVGAFLSRNIFELVHSEDLEWTQEVFTRLLQDPGGRQNGNFRLRRSDGSWRWVEAIATNMLNEPAVNAVVINYRDITERKQAEEALRASQAKYQNLVETSHDLIWSVDAEGKIAFLNRAAKEIYGYEPEELIGRSFFDVMNPDHVPQNNFKEALGQAREFREVESQVHHKDGREIILSTNSIVIRDNKGNVIGATGSSRDITLRKRVEDMLKEERNLLRTLIDNIPDRIYAIDAQGRKTLSNAADWKACGGKAMEDVLGKTDFDTYPPELAEEFWQFNKAVLDSGNPIINFEEPGLDFEGNRVSILTTKIPLRDDEGNVIGLVGVGRDITERKRIEGKLQLSDQILQRVSALVLVADSQGNILYVSPAAKTILGYEPEELLGDSWWKISHLESDASLREKEYVRQAARREIAITTEAYERPIQDRSGNTHWISWVDTAGLGETLIGVGHDVTERKQAEERVRYSENRYRLAIKATNDVIWEWNAKTNQLLWSENAQQAFGYSPEEVGPNEKWWDEHIHPDDRERVLTKLNALIAGSETIWLEEYRFLLKDGSYAYISDHAYIERDAQEMPLRMIGAMSNITARKLIDVERQALLEIMQGLANTTDLQELLELIHHSIAKVIYADNLFVVLYDEERGLFEEIYSVDQYDPPAPPARLEKSITSYVFRDGEPLLLTQASFGELVSQGKIELVGTNSASWLGVPLKTSGRTIGVIAVQDYENDNRYSERDKEFLESIASQVALAIERKQADVELKQKNDDLALLNAINEAVVRGQDLNSIIESLAKELSRIFSVRGSTVYSTIYMLSSDQKSIVVQNYSFSPEVAHRIEKLVGFKIPAIEFPIKEGDHFHKMMTSRQTAILDQPPAIQSWIDEFIETKFLPPWARMAVRKLVPQISKLLNIKSIIGVPLISEQEIIGFLDVSTSDRFTANDLKRIENLAGQLTAVIQRQQAEQALRTSNERFHLISKAVNDAVWDWDLLTDQVSWNEAIHTLFKYKPDEVRADANWWVENIHPDDREQILNSVQAVIHSSTANHWKNEYRFQRADGSYAFIFDRGYIIRDDSKEALRMVGAMQDITERKQAEEALHQSEALYRRAIEVAGAVPYYETYYEEGRSIKYEFIGEGIRQITGYAPEEFSAALWDSLVEEVNLVGDLAGYSLEEGIQRVRTGENSIWKCEHRLRDRAGKTHWVFEAAVELRDENGISYGSIGMYQDITERKQAEEAEREQRALAEALRDTAETLNSTLEYGEVLDRILAAVGRVVPHDAATIMLVEGEFAHVVRSYGYDKHSPGFDVMGVELPLAGTDNLWQMLETGQTVVVSDTYTYPGWKRFAETDWLRSNVGVPISVYGKVIGFILLDSHTPCFFTSVHAERLEAFADQAALAIHNAHLLQQAQEEIAERKQAEIALMESTAQFRTLFEASPDAIVLIDPDHWSIIDCNTAACQMNGYEREELIGQCIDILNVSPDNPNERIAYMERIRQNHVLHYETFHQHKNGDLFPVEVSTSLIKFGARNLILGIDRDITERRQAEEEIGRRAEETSALLQTSLALTNLDWNVTLQTIGSSAKALFAADGCRVFLMEPDNQSLRCVLALQENSSAFSDLRIKLGDGVTGAVAKSGRAEIVNEMEKDPRAVQVPGTADKEEEAIMFAPLKERDRTIGVLSIRRAGKERSFKQTDLELLEAFASMAASAVSNARLFEETQRRLVELHASEERFRQLADNIEEAFWMTDAETDEEIYISAAAEVIWDRPIRDLTSEPVAFIDTVHPDDQTTILKAIEKEKNGEKVEIEYRILRPNGSVRWVWDRAFPIFDDSGKVKRIAGITADITERREAEIALHKSQSRYRELFDSSPISIWEEDYSLVKKRIDDLLESGINDFKKYFSNHPDELKKLASLVKITDANKAALELYRIEQKEVVLKELIQILSPEALSHFQEEILGLMSPSKRFTWEGTDKMLNGSHIEVIVNGSIPQGYEEDWSKVIVSVSNITERRQAQQQLRKLSRAVEQSASSIVITDTTGNIEYVNPKFTEVTGYSLEETIGQNPRILKSGHTSKEVYKQLWETVSSGKQWHGELLNKKKNAELYWEHVTISPIFNEYGEITHFVGVKEDITQRKQTEAETHRHLTELEALYENGLAVGRLLTANEIGNRVINTFARYLQWHHVTIRLRKGESDDLELVSFNLPGLADLEKPQIEQRFASRINKVGQGMSGWVIQTGLSFRTGNVRSHSQYIATQPGIRSGLYMPLKVGEQVIGVISVESELPDAFTEQDERLLATLANQAAIAFENARLYETVQKELLERKRTEEALRASEVHYRELANSITDILFELDQDLHYIHWNRASELFSGISAEEAIGKSMQEVFAISDQQARREEIYKSVLIERRARTFETEILTKGQKRALEITAYPSARGVSVVAKDVTERKQSELIMQKRFELMEFSAHHSLDELMQKTADEVSELTGSPTGFIHFMEEDQTTVGTQTWSTSTLQMFQVPAIEGLHLSLNQAGVWAEAARQRRPMIQNDYESLSLKRGLPQGHLPITREMVIPVIRNERIMAIVGVANKPQEYTQYDLHMAERLADHAWDIAERKQMETALQAERNQLAQRVDERTADLSRANSNLARALRVKDEFLANMSHELRTPLNAILGLSESLSEQIAGPLNEKQQKYIATISESGHHLLSLINDILDLAKIDAGQITLDINKVDIHSVCQASLRMIKQLAQKKNQDVSLLIDNGLGLMWADERRLKQMIVNLLGNAVKFTPENGKLGLEVHGDEEANKISFTVWDEGIGIKQEDLARLFQPFVQLDSGLAREATGTGLGLALVAQMARLHGGSIMANSEPGKGSRFTIVLPWEPALAVDAATRMRITSKFPAIKVDDKNKPTILLVEDTREVTMLVKDYLELAGYKVATAQDGVDAIVQAKLVRPDLILMDVQMPRMDGLEATRKLKSEPDFRYTPIIALTALAMPSDRERCLEAGMDEYISKPVNLKTLVKMIQGSLLNNQKVKSQ